MDALTLLRQDHRKLERLLERLERPEGLDHEQHRVLLAQVGTALRQHVDDEGIFYAAFRQEAAARGMDTGMLDTGAQQHRLIGELAGELAGMAPGDPGLGAKVRVLCEQVRSHLDTEDTTLLTAAEDILSDDELIDLGRRIEERKRVLDAQRELADTMRPLTGSRASRFVAGAAVATAVAVAVLAGRRRPARGRRRRGTVRRR
jgi:hemerythrin-like domain-containing protein